MPLFICRWNNGDCSFVVAPNRTEAIVALDEVGNAESGEIFTIEDFMIHLVLRDDGTFGVEGFGEQTQSSIKRAYPFLIKALEEERSDEQVRRAVGRERRRVRGHRNQASTDIGRRLQDEMDSPSVLVDKLVEQVAKKRLKEFKPKGAPH